jgi:hemoglobin
MTTTIGGKIMIKQSRLITSLGFLLYLLLTNSVHADGKSLYERLGGDKGARAITEDIWNNHSKNPIVNNRFVNSDPSYVKQKVFELIAASTGGSTKYTGKDMLTTHAGMNISDMEFNAVVDDVMNALEQNHVGKQEQNEMLAILWSVKDQVVNGKMTTKSLSPN